MGLTCFSIFFVVVGGIAGHDVLWMAVYIYMCVCKNVMVSVMMECDV